MTLMMHAVYGTPPVALVTVPADAAQCSPLIPGSMAVEELAASSLTSAILYAPPGTVERRFVLAHMLQALLSGAPFTVLAPNDKGGTRLAKELAGFGCEVVNHAKHHHRICSGVRPVTVVGIEDAIAVGSMQQHPAHGMWTQPGIFSWDRIDVGTALLLQHLPELKGNGADFGCGMGVLSRTVLGSAAVTSLLMIDIDRRAIACAQRNISDARVQYRWADMCQGAGVAAQSLDFVVMNPPFHAAGEEDRTLGQRFIAAAADGLKTGGQCWITANRHLPYEELLAQRFARVALMDMADGFKIFRAEK